MSLAEQEAQLQAQLAAVQQQQNATTRAPTQTTG